MRALIYFIIILSVTCHAQITKPEFDKAIHLNNGNNLDLATNNLKELQAKFPNDSKVFFLKGMLDYIKKDYNQSIINLTQAIALNPKFVNAFIARSTTHATLENYEKAIIDQTKAINLEPNNIDFLSNRAYFYSENKQFAESLNDVKTKILLQPNNITNYLEAVIVCKKIDQSYNADVFFQQALSSKTINKNKVEKLFADYLLDNSRFQEAEIKYKNALATNEKDFNANDFQNLAIVSEKIQNYEASIGYYKKAIAKSPKNILVYNNLSSVYIELKRWQELKENAESSLEISPNDAMANMYMAIGLKYTGKENLALEFEAKSKEIDNIKSR